MYKDILVPTDGSRLSAKAVKTGVRLAKALGARVTGVYVVAPYAPPVYGDAAIYVPEISPQMYRKHAEKAARKALSALEIEAQTAGVSARTVTRIDANPWQAIIRAAQGSRCDLVVMASHGRRGIAGFLLGSETTKVLTHSKVPVLVCR
jgi:nucleotide-binding universal stress UspA family protein